MLTAKYVSETGYEYVVQVASVEYTKEKGVTLNYGSDSLTYTATSGQVYIMNDLGKTVASYHLSSASPQ